MSVVWQQTKIMMLRNYKTVPELHNNKQRFKTFIIFSFKSFNLMPSNLYFVRIVLFVSGKWAKPNVHKIWKFLRRSHQNPVGDPRSILNKMNCNVLK